MLKQLNDTLDKTCLLGLTYFDSKGNSLKQSLFGARVVAINDEQGITLALLGGELDKSKSIEFIIPTSLSCWFEAPAGEYHTSQDTVKIINPDYLVTWDVYQTRGDAADAEQQWWEWVPRCAEPNVSA